MKKSGLKGPAICPECYGKQEQTLTSCTACQAPLRLKNRYLLLKVIGRGVSLTYFAYDTGLKEYVVIKELSIHKLESWKQEELFLRESNTLRQLDHPGIPKLKDFFTVDHLKNKTHYLVQEFFAGQNLEKELVTTRFTEKEIFNLMIEMLRILEYLHTLKPAVIHRDIKPPNIIRRTDGSLSLVDFGAVKERLDKGGYERTVAGTFGFMAPEQLIGDAVIQSDYYGLAVTALSLLAREKPEKLITAQHRMNSLAEGFLSEDALWLFRCFITPEITERPSSAMEAIRLVATAKSGTSARKTVQPVKQMQWGKTNVSSRKAVLAGSVFLIILVSILGFYLVQESAVFQTPVALPQSVYVHLPVCRNGQCSPLPEGLLDFQFGMDLQSACKIQPQLSSLQQEKPQSIQPTDPYYFADMNHLFFIDDVVVVPEGFRLKMETRFMNLPCHATLEFVVAKTLSRMLLEFTPVSSQENHEKIEAAVIGAFYLLYGLETEYKEKVPQYLFETVKLDREWIWDNQTTGLIVTSRYESFRDNTVSSIFPLEDKSILTIENVSQKHRDLIEQYAMQAEENYRKVVEKQKRLAEKKILEENEQIDNLLSTQEEEKR